MKSRKRHVSGGFESLHTMPAGGTLEGPVIAVQRGVSGHLRLTFGSGPEDPVLFALTLTPQYVVPATGKEDSVTFDE